MCERDRERQRCCSSRHGGLCNLGQFIYLQKLEYLTVDSADVMMTSCEGSLCSKEGGSKALAASSQTSVLAHEHFRTPIDVRGLPAKQSVDPIAMPPLGIGLTNALGGLISGVAVAGMFNPWVSIWCLFVLPALLLKNQFCTDVWLPGPGTVPVFEASQALSEGIQFQEPIPGLSAES